MTTNNAATVQTFTFTNNTDTEVRTATKDDQPWFIAKDICDALGLKNVTNALVALDSTDKTNLTICNDAGYNSQLRAVSESGMYHLIFKSRKPAAKAFARWVTHEVLPMIRKTGGTYMSAEAALEVIKDPRYVMGVMELIKRQYIENGRLVETIEIEKLPPKEQQFDVRTKTPRLA